MSHRLWITLLLSGAIAACSSPVRLDDTPAEIEQRNAQGQGDGSQGSGADASGAGAGTAEIRPEDRAVATVDAADKADEPEAPIVDPLLAKRSIFFDYDSFTIREEFRPVVEAHARNLIANPEQKIVLQGNTDERGAREYNLALGQKRAEAVRRALVILGVSESQLEAVSFGEERPRAIAQTEEAYAENRRTDIVYP